MEERCESSKKNNWLFMRGNLLSETCIIWKEYTLLLLILIFLHSNQIFAYRISNYEAPADNVFCLIRSDTAGTIFSVASVSYGFCDITNYTVWFEPNLFWHWTTALNYYFIIQLSIFYIGFGFWGVLVFLLVCLVFLGKKGPLIILII